MGLKCGHAINYCINDLSFKDVLVIARSRCRGINNNACYRIPTIDVDSSWVVRRLSGLSADMQVASLIRLCSLFTEHGCCVNLVCDGNIRHHTKRSTAKRMIDSYRSKVEYHYLKCRLMSVSIERETDSLNDEERQQIDDEEILLKKEIKTIEKNCQIVLLTLAQNYLMQ